MLLQRRIRVFQMLLIVNISICMFLIISLTMTSRLLFTSATEGERNQFSTANISINLNNSNTIFDGTDMIFPNKTVNKSFFVKNESDCDVYFRIYLDNIEGVISDTLIVTISDENQVIYSAIMDEFTKEKIEKAFGTLVIDEEKELTFSIYCPKEVEFIVDKQISFDIKAEAVQVKNNPNAKF